MNKDQMKKLTPMMLATALTAVSSTAVAYDHNEQSSVFNSEKEYNSLQDNTFTQSTNPQTGMIYSDHD
ncbi:MAG: hypothetical protein GY861_19250 [bacterium]|nr:hypothetical protein [bacterium]